MTYDRSAVSRNRFMGGPTRVAKVLTGVGEEGDANTGIDGVSSEVWRIRLWPV
jgi:hypothetical protein